MIRARGNSRGSALHGAPSRHSGKARRRARVAFYSHDSFGLGHFRRNLKLAWAIRALAPDTEILMVTGSPRATSFTLPPGVVVAKLPAVTKDAAGSYVTRGLDSPIGDTIRVRKALIRSAVLGFDPDVLIVDHTPIGLRGELLPLLGDLRHRTHTQLVLGLRDIIDEPARVRDDWRRNGVPRILEEIYHHIWVYGSPLTFPVETCYGLSAEVVRKLEYRGYVTQTYRDATGDPSASLGFSDRARPHVLCLVGGGEDGMPVARAFLQMIAFAAPAWNGTLVTGPFLDRAERHSLAEVASHLPHVQILRFTSDVERLVSGSDVVITMGGYNSVTEAVGRGRRTLVIPRVFPRREQLLRARAFESLGMVRCLHPDTLDANRLAAAATELLHGPAPVSPTAAGLNWNGATDFAKRVAEVLNEQTSKESLSHARTQARA
ncbi:MAG: glycosyltransferase family protein [Planctomycetota bacterium]